MKKLSVFLITLLVIVLLQQYYYFYFNHKHILHFHWQVWEFYVVLGGVLIITTSESFVKRRKTFLIYIYLFFPDEQNWDHFLTQNSKVDNFILTLTATYLTEGGSSVHSIALKCCHFFNMQGGRFHFTRNVLHMWKPTETQGLSQKRKIKALCEDRAALKQNTATLS